MNAQSAIMRRFGIGLVAVCATLLTSACATGQQAQTAHEVPAIDGANGNVGSIQLHNVAIKAPPNGPAYGAGDIAELQLVIVNIGHDSDTLESVSTPTAGDFGVFASAGEASAAASPSTSSSASSSASSSTSSSASPSASSSASSGASSSASSSTSSSAPGASAASSSAAPSAPVSREVRAGQSLAFGVTSTGAVLVLRLTKALFPGASVSITFTFAKAGSVTITVPVQISTNTSPVGISIAPPSAEGSS